MPAPRLVVVLVLSLPAACLAQIQVDDRPKILETGPLTREERNRRQADEMLREARTLFGVGLIRQRHEQLLQAVSRLEKAAELDPESLEVRRALVPLYVNVGREPEAMTLCRMVLDRDPHDAETGYEYARLLRSDGQTAEAIAVLQKAVATRAARERPERLLFMLSDLYDLVEKQGDYAAAATAQDSIIQTIESRREQLLYGNGFTREDLQASLARAYERLGKARVKTKEYDRAATAFRGARDTLLQSNDPEARHLAVRLNGNLSELLAAQEKWAEAMEALDRYLEHSPVEVEPYERKAELLRKVGREREVVPTLRKYAAREPFHLGLQLLLARELGKSATSRRDAEVIYRVLLEKNIKPEIYRELFRHYRAADQMEQVIDLLDQSAAVIARPEARVDEREAAHERAQAMLAVLRTDSALVVALLPVALKDADGRKKREINTWALLAALAARTRHLADAEVLFRNCLREPLSADNEHKVYGGLLEVLSRQKKHRAIVELCRNALNGPRAARNTNAVLFEANMAGALAALGEHEDALAHADRAVKLSSEAAKVRARCQRAEILALAGRYADAAAECNDTIKEFPQSSYVRAARYTLSTVYSLQGEDARSEEQLRLILESDPNAALANNNLGYQLADRNIQLDEAERLIRRAIEADRVARKEIDDDGENAAYLDSLGWVLFRKGDLRAARDWLQKAAALPDGADDPTVWDHLGDVYAKLNEPEKARDAWQSALRLYQDDARRKSEARRAEVEKKIKSLDR